MALSSPTIAGAARPSSGSTFIDNVLAELVEAQSALIRCHEKLDRLVGHIPETKDQLKQPEDSAFNQGLVMCRRVKETALVLADRLNDL
jgi:hypothetical protein